MNGTRKICQSKLPMLRWALTLAVAAALACVLAACGDVQIEVGRDDAADIQATPTSSGAAATGVGRDDSAGSLGGTAWVLTALGSVESPEGVLRGTEVTAEFVDDGYFRGDAGCNTYSGDYQAGAGDFSAGEVMFTERACESPEGVMEQESRFLELLAQAKSYEIDGSQLKLTNFWDETLVFSKAP